MTVQTMNLELPVALFQRVSIKEVEDARELVTSLVENYAQGLEGALRQQAFEAYYMSRTPEDEAEEQEILLSPHFIQPIEQGIRNSLDM